MAIDVKTAVVAATRYAKELYEPEISGLQLEEVEEQDVGGQRLWRVTLSFYLPTRAVSPIDRLLDQTKLIAQGERVTQHFKTFDVRDVDGTVAAMRIRKT